MTDEKEPGSREVILSIQDVSESHDVLDVTVVSGSQTVGDQSIEFAERQIRIDTAAHQREMERHRILRELEKDKREEDEKFKDRHHQRVRNDCTYAVVVFLIIVGLAGSFYVAVTATDPSLQTWAQGLTTTIAGVVGGAFAGYLIGERR